MEVACTPSVHPLGDAGDHLRCDQCSTSSTGGYSVPFVTDEDFAGRHPDTGDSSSNFLVTSSTAES